MIVAESLSLLRGDNTLFSALSFTVNAGEVLVLRGANGSGKTSLLRVLAGLTRADAGRIKYEGSVWYSGHEHALKDELTASENLLLVMQINGLKANKDAVFEALSGLGLATRAHFPVKKLSQGQKRRVGLARLNITKKNIWLLDEPTNALDDEGVAWFMNAVTAHTSQGGLAVIATHLPMALKNALELRL